MITNIGGKRGGGRGGGDRFFEDLMPIENERCIVGTGQRKGREKKGTNMNVLLVERGGGRGNQITVSLRAG